MEDLQTTTEILIQILFLENLGKIPSRSRRYDLRRKESHLKGKDSVLGKILTTENYNNAKGSIVHVVFVKMILMAQTVGEIFIFHCRFEEFRVLRSLKLSRHHKLFREKLFSITLRVFHSAWRLLSRKSHPIWNNSIYWWIKIIGLNWKSNKKHEENVTGKKRKIFEVSKNLLDDKLS